MYFDLAKHIRKDVHLLLVQLDMGTATMDALSIVCAPAMLCQVFRYSHNYRLMN